MFKVSTKEDVRRAIGYMLIGRYHGMEPGAEVREVLQSGMCRNIIEFADNTKDLEQLAENHRQFTEWSGGCLFSVDQEGGRVQRIKAPLTVYPPMGVLAQKNDSELMELVGKAMALELRALGYHIDFAPVADVNSNPDNPVIGDRSFGNSPEKVALLSCAFIKGLQAGGIAACAKHFPGHGDSSKDSHKELPIIALNLDEIRAIHWPPFKAAAAAGVALMMSAHLLVPALDGVRPATLSPTIIGRLREEIGFNGPVASDALDMGALSEIPLEKRAIGAVLADLDLLTLCGGISDVPAAFEALVHAEEQGIITKARLEKSLQRLKSLWNNYFRPQPDSLESIENLTEVARLELEERW